MTTPENQSDKVFDMNMAKTLDKKAVTNIKSEIPKRRWVENSIFGKGKYVSCWFFCKLLQTENSLFKLALLKEWNFLLSTRENISIEVQYYSIELNIIQKLF